MRLTPETIRIIEEILSDEKTAELAVRKNEIAVWAVNSKKKYGQPVA